jgi:hypothetical protein
MRSARRVFVILVVAALPENATGVFKDSYLLDFRVIVDCRSRITVQSSRHRCRNNAVNWRTPSKHE